MSSIHKYIAVILLFLGATIPSGFSQGLDSILEQEINGTATDSELGKEISVDGTTALIALNGAVHVYENSAGSWNLTQELIPENGELSFGCSISVNGENALIAADKEGIYGSVYYYQRREGQWVLRQKITSNMGEEYFLKKVAVSGDTAVITREYVGEYAEFDGLISIYDITADGLSLAQTTTVSLELGQMTSLSIDHNTLFVGGIRRLLDPRLDPWDGFVVIFEKVDGTWVRTKQLYESNSNFGQSICVKGDIAIIGSEYIDPWMQDYFRAGAYMYVRRDGVWEYDQRIWYHIADYGFGSANLFSVDLDGGYAVIGCEENGTNMVNMYEYNNDVWSLKNQLIESDVGAFGCDVGKSGSKLLVGAKADDIGGANSGSVFCYDVALVDPFLSITSPANGDTFPFGTDVSVTAEGYDSDGIVGIRFDVDGAAYDWDNTAPYETVLTGLTEGQHDILVWMKDGLGNWIRSDARSITIEDIPLYVTITSPADGDSFTVGADVSVTAEGYDIDGIDGIRFDVDGAWYDWDTEAPYETTISGLSVGNHDILVWMKDRLGNWTMSNTRSITIEERSSNVTITSPANGDAISFETDLSVTAEGYDADGIAGIRFDVDGAWYDWDTEAPYETTIPGISEGSHDIQVWMKDTMGNWIKSESIMITKKGPTEYATITSPTDHAVFSLGAEVPVIAEAHDAKGIDGVRFDVDGEVYYWAPLYQSLGTSYYRSYETSLTELAVGDHELVFWMLSNQGPGTVIDGDWIKSETITITIEDTSPPLSL